jgi:uncharacterized protein YdeI (YjbR/CyaY-like superfamily)
MSGLQSPNGKEVVVPRSRTEWRAWLEERPDRVEGVWVAMPRPRSEVEGPAYEDLVEEALCFGWIDGQAAKGNDDLTLQWYSPRRKGSIWAKSNKERVERLAAAGLMTDRGRAVVERAKTDGSWSQADDVEALVVHDDLAEALDASPAARRPSRRWRPHTRRPTCGTSTRRSGRRHGSDGSPRPSGV